MSKNEFIVNKNGYVLLELVISLSIFSLILLATAMIIFDLSASSSKLAKQKSNLDNIRIAECFLRDQIRHADKIDLERNNDFTMKRIRVHTSENKRELEHDFEFKPRKKIINFGGNKLADNISDVKINYFDENKLLSIKISIDNYRDLSFVMYLRDTPVLIKTLS